MSQKNVDLFKKCYNSFIYGENFSKFSVVVAGGYPFAPIIDDVFFDQVALLTGSDVIMM